MGPELMTKMREQAARFGAEFVTADADRVDLSSPPVRRLGRRRGVPSASRSSSRPARRRACSDCPSEQRLLGHGVSTCATCDGFFFREKPLAIVGGGDSAIEEAIFLTKFATKVTIVHRRDELRASKIMQERALANEKIEFRWNSVVEDIVGNGAVEALDADGHRDRRLVAPRGRGALRRDRARPEHEPVHRPARARRERATSRPRPTRRQRRSRASSPPATCRTTCTGRPSPPPGAAAWPRSRPSAGSRPPHAATPRDSTPP